MTFADYSWLIGVLLVLVGSAISNLGLNLQKLTHVRHGKRDAIEMVAVQPPKSSPTHRSRVVSPTHRNGSPPSSPTAMTDNGEQPSYFTKPLWLLGLALVILGSVADFVALGFAPQTVVAPLGSFTLVSNIFFAQYFAGETFSAEDLKSTVAIIVGCGVSVGFATHADRGYSLEEILAFYTHPRFIFYAVVVGAVVAAMYIAVHRCEDIRTTMRAGNAPDVDEFRRVSKIQRFLFGALSGIIGAQSVLFAKGFSELVRELFLKLFLHFESYGIIGGMLASIFLQIKWMNEGLQRYDALYLVPVFQSFWICVSVMGGLIVYGEATSMSPLQAAMFSLGIAITIWGVYSLSKRSSTGHEQEKSMYMKVDGNSPGTSSDSSHPAQPMHRARTNSFHMLLPQMGGQLSDSGADLRLTVAVDSPDTSVGPGSGGDSIHEEDEENDDSDRLFTLPRATSSAVKVL